MYQSVSRFTKVLQQAPPTTDNTTKRDYQYKRSIKPNNDAMLAVIYNVIRKTNTIEEAKVMNRYMVSQGLSLPLYLHTTAYNIFLQCFLHNKSFYDLHVLLTCIDVLSNNYLPVIVERPCLGVYNFYREPKDNINKIPLIYNNNRKLYSNELRRRSSIRESVGNSWIV